MSNTLLLLMDGMAMAYRAFHAIPDLSTRDGRPTNALFGFIKMVQQLRDAHRPTHQAVVFDGGLPPRRMNLLPHYKAQRAEMPDGLAAQLEPIGEFLAAARIPALRLQEEEADDVMATLARRAERESFAVRLATSDKDLFQMVSPLVQVVAPVKDGPRMGPAEVAVKLGVGPELVTSFLALTGDAVDNIPGVPGVGPKTASKLLLEFGSLAALGRRLSEVKSDRIRQALEQHWPDVERNHRLVTLETDVPALPDLSTLAVQAPDVARLVSFLHRMEMQQLARGYQEAELNLL